MKKYVFRKNLLIILSLCFLLLIAFPVLAEETDGEEEPDFFTICEEGSPEEVREAIEDGAELNQRDSKGRTPLMAAARSNSNHVVIVNLVLSGARVDLTDNKSWTAIMYAATYNSNPDVVRALIFFRADLTIKNREGNTALMLALENGHTQRAELLINEGRGINLKNDKGLTPLMIAVKNKNESKTIEKLISEDAKINVQDKEGRTALMYAVSSNQNKIVTLLLEEGAEVDLRNEQRQNALIVAAKNGADFRIYDQLLTAGIEVNIKDRQGKTPLLYALEENQSYEKISLLIDWEAEVNETDNSGINAAGYAVKYSSPEILKLLINRRVNVNKKSVQKITPLMMAAKERENTEFISLLLDAGANIEARDYRGFTPLMYAVEANTPEVVEFVLNQGADPVVRDNHRRSIAYYLEENEQLIGTDVYWEILYQQPEGEKLDLKETKSRMVTGMLSTAVPSAGHFYTGNWWPKGALFLLGESALFALAQNQDSSGKRNTAYVTLGLLKVWEVYDALQETDKLNEFVTDYNEEAKKYNEYRDKNGDIGNYLEKF